MLKVESVQQAWQQWLNKLPPNRRDDDDVQEIRWMIEELRVSFFAQQLGTPVSDLGQTRVAGDGANYAVARLVVPGGAALTGATRLSLYPRQSKSRPSL